MESIVCCLINEKEEWKCSHLIVWIMEYVRFNWGDLMNYQKKIGRLKKK